MPATEGAAVGIVIAILAFLLVCSPITVLLIRKHLRNALKTKDDEAPENMVLPTGDGTIWKTKVQLSIKNWMMKSLSYLNQNVGDDEDHERKLANG